MLRCQPFVTFSHSTRDEILSRGEAHRAACAGVAAACDTRETAEASGQRRASKAASKGEAEAHRREFAAFSALTASSPESVQGAHTSPLVPPEPGSPPKSYIPQPRAARLRRDCAGLIPIDPKHHCLRGIRRCHEAC